MKNSKILIVEDEPIVALHLKKCLSRIGYQVVGSAQSGKDALRIVEKNTPDLILMDIILEGEQNGISLAKVINEQYGIPIVYLTAYSDDKTLMDASRTRPYGYLTKPFKEGDLKGVIETALYKHFESVCLKNNTAWYKTIFNSFFCPLIALDTDENILLATKAMKIYTDIPPEELLGKSFRLSGIKIVGEDGKPVDLPLQQVITSGDLRKFERVMIQGKQECLMNLLVCPIQKNKENLGCILIFTEFRENEDNPVEMGQWESKVQEYAAMILSEGIMVEVCPYCKKGFDPVSREWCEIEVFIRGKRIANSSHHVCPDCSLNLGFDIKKLKGDSLN